MPFASAADHRPALGPALLLMLASGFAGLGYQIVWTQQLGLWLGHESAGVLAVLGAFFGGLSLGTWLLGARIENSALPRRWYAACEALIGAWGLVLVLVMPAAGRWTLALIGADAGPLRHWGVAFGVSFLLLLPATAAMGATLPALARALGRHLSGSVAPLYAANTAGAVLGVLATAFWLIPAWGLSASALVCVALNCACALAALVVLQDAAPAEPPAARAGLFTLAATGLLGIGYEVLVVRVLSQVAEDTVYTFACLLAVYLLGTSLGAALYARWRQRLTRTRLLQATAVACLLGLAPLWQADGIRQALGQALPPTVTSAIGAEALLAVLAFGLPTVAMGALFCALTDGLALSRALAVNTLGAAVAAPLCGLLLAPWLGPKMALLALVLGYLLLTRSLGSWPVAGVVVALAALAPPLAIVDVPDGGRLLSYRDGALAAVSVTEDADGTARLRINNRQQEGSNATLHVDGRQALLPLLAHPSPQRALFLGLGSGVTASVAAQQPGVTVDAVELLPEVIEASAHFRDELPAPRLHLIAADARRYVRASAARYDVIVSDNFHPARSGSAALYTVEHFRAVRERLAPGGLFCQWLPLHQLDLETLRSITASFLVAFPQGSAILASNSLDTPVVGLIGSAHALALAPARWQALSGEQRRQFGLDHPLAVPGAWVAGPSSLQAWSQAAPLNTDDHPWVAYRAPRITYLPETRPRDRLLALLAELKLRADEVFMPGADPALLRRIEAYAQARQAYLAAGRDITLGADAATLWSRLRAPLVAVLRQSPDFQPAREPLERLAMAVAPVDPQAATQLRADLDALPSLPTLTASP